MEQDKPPIDIEDYRTFVDAISKNEYGLADLFEQFYKNKLIFDHSKGSWYFFSGHSWLEDTVEYTRSCYAHLLDGMRIALNKLSVIVNEKITNGEKSPPEQAIEKSMRRYLHNASTDRATSAVLKIARHGCGDLSTDGNSWNLNPMVGGTRQGKIDFKNGEVYPGLPTDMINQCMKADYTGTKENYGDWDRILLEIFCGDVDMVEYMQRICGYALTGLTTEDQWWIFNGEASAGKSIILNGLTNAMGDYACSIPASNLMLQRNPPSISGPRTDILNMFGKRVGRASETIEGQRLDDGKIKGIVSGEPQVARYPHSKHEKTFKPHLKLLLDTNHLPRTTADDSGVWRRLIVIPFTARFCENPSKPNEYKINKELKYKILEPEYSELILAWAVQGCLLWQLIGLQPPQKVIDATRQYRVNEDILQQFITDSCEIDEFGIVSVSELNNRLETYCKEMDGRRPPSAKKLNAFLSKNFGISSTKSNGARIFRGIRVSE